MIRGWMVLVLVQGVPDGVVLVIVQGVLDGCGMQGGEPCMLDDGLFGLQYLINAFESKCVFITRIYANITMC